MSRILFQFRTVILAAVAAGPVIPPVVTAEDSVALNRDFSRKPAPYFQNGFFWSYDHEENPLTPKALVFGPDGGVRLQVPFERPGVSNPDIGAVAPSVAGGVVVSLSGWAPDGRIVHRLEWLNPSGTLERLIETTPFAAVALHVRPNGEVWAAGRELEERRLRKGHDILRRYSPGGELVETMLGGDSFSPESRKRGHPVADCYLIGDGDRVAFLSVTAMELVILTPGSPMHRWRLPEPRGGAWITGAAFLDGDVVVSAQVRDARGSQAKLYRWAPAESGWHEIPAPSRDGRPWVGYLLGADPAGLWLSDELPQVVRYRP